MLLEEADAQFKRGLALTPNLPKLFVQNHLAQILSSPYHPFGHMVSEFVSRIGVLGFYGPDSRPSAKQLSDIKQTLMDFLGSLENDRSDELRVKILSKFPELSLDQLPAWVDEVTEYGW